MRGLLQAMSLSLLVSAIVSAVLTGSTLAAQVPADEVLKDFKIVRVVDEDSVEIAIGSGRGRWHADLTIALPGLRKGQQGRLAAKPATLEKGTGKATLRFKGTDEELQASIRRLGRD